MGQSQALTQCFRASAFIAIFPSRTAEAFRADGGAFDFF
jgi:hypothetical protein